MYWEAREPSRDGDIPSEQHSEHVYAMYGGMDRLLTALNLSELDIRNRAHAPLNDGDNLRALVEAELLLSDWWHRRHGCGCGKHL